MEEVSPNVEPKDGRLQTTDYVDQLRYDPQPGYSAQSSFAPGTSGPRLLATES